MYGRRLVRQFNLVAPRASYTKLHKKLGTISAMNQRKLKRCEREWLRAQRAELQLISAKAKERWDFDYVVNPPQLPRVAFGTSQEREVMPLHGPQMPQIMRKTFGEYREYPGPTDYKPELLWKLEKDYPSNLGFSAFCSKIPRLATKYQLNVPPVGIYETEPQKPIKQAAKPFGKSMPRVEKVFLTPGPPTYPCHIQPKKYKLSTAFNTRRKYWPAVAVFCTPFNLAKCMLCNTMPIGDYWHNFDTDTDICRLCMGRKRAQLRACDTKFTQKRQLRRDMTGYVPARYCGFFHNHNGVKAAIPIMSQKLLRFKITKENYLYKYENDLV